MALVMKNEVFEDVTPPGSWRLRLTLFVVRCFVSPWWWRSRVPPKRRFSQDPHGVTSEKTAFCIENITSPEDGNRSSFRNAVFSSFLQFRAMHKAPKPSDSECYTPSSISSDSNMKLGSRFKCICRYHIWSNNFAYCHSLECRILSLSLLKPLLENLYILSNVR
jgi:hypothetical protein